MSGERWRGEGGEVEQHYRRFIREALGDARDGTVVEDVDIVHRLYNPGVGNDPGWLRLIEVKRGTARMSHGQWTTYRSLDRLCQDGDPTARRYGGAFVISTEDPFDWNEVWWFQVNGVDLQADEFVAWLRRERTDVPALAFSPEEHERWCACGMRARRGVA